MLNGEDLFFALMMLHNEDSDKKHELMERGFFTQDGEHTKEAERFLQDFINRYKNPLYQAMKENSNEWYKAMAEIGLTNYSTYLILAAKLKEEGLFIETKHHNYRVV